VQTPTHILSGVLIERALRPIPHRPTRLMVTGGAALLSHAILDRLARLTYHPPDPQFDSLVWVSYHAGIVVLTVVLIARYWADHKVGIVCANLPDFDWLILHPTRLLGAQLPFWQDANLHSLLYLLIDPLPPFRWFGYLPNLNLDPWGALVEIGLLAGLGGVLWRRS
jgi:hypothetical protein